MASTKLEEIRLSSLVLIDKIAETGKRLMDNVIALVASFSDYELVKSILNKVKENQEISDQIMLQLQIDNMPLSISSDSLNKLLKSTYKEMQNGFKLSDKAIDKILFIEHFKNEFKGESKDYSTLKSIANILSLNVQQKLTFSEQVVNLIEQAILLKEIKLNCNIINGYTKIIKAGKF